MGASHPDDPRRPVFALPDRHRGQVDVASKQPSAAVCIDEVESLSRRLQARLSLALDPRGEDDWNLFSRELEDRLAALEARCVDSDAIDA